MAELINATVAESTSSDITVSAGTTVVFSLTGSHTGANIEIRKKDSDNAYWLMTEDNGDGRVREAVLNNAIRVRSIANDSSSSLTLQVFKPASGVASGVDQD